MLVAPAPPASRHTFHELHVSAAEPASDDGSSVTVSLAVPAGLREVFAFTPGQHVTLRAEIEGTEVRRSYSICSTPAELAEHGVLRVGVRLLPDGVFSRFVAAELTRGAGVRAMPPTGNFTTALDGGRRRRYLAVVAGSGITPVLSLVASALEREPASTFTLLYGNRSADSTMFAEQLADLKDRYPARFSVSYLFSREELVVGVPGRHWDAETLGSVFGTAHHPSTVDEWFVCGPQEMVSQAVDVLRDRGVPMETVHVELFHASRQATPVTSRPVHEQNTGETFEVRLDGRRTTVPLRPGQDLLNTALAARPELPFSCSAGVCGTCRARLVSGTVRTEDSWALTAEERADGLVLSCQTVADSPDVVLDFDDV